MEIFQVKEDIAALSAKIGDIQQKANKENRVLNAQELGIVAEMENGIDELRKHLPERPQTLQNGTLGRNGLGTSRNVESPLVIPPGGKKDIVSMFGNRGYNWPDKDSNFLSALFSGRHHPGLIKNTMSETVPSSGGYLVPTQHYANIQNVALEQSIVFDRAFVVPMTSDSMDVPATEIGSHQTSLFGGFVASYKDEAATLAENSPKVRKMTMTAKKLTGLVRFSPELDLDTPGGISQVETICGQGLGWYRDDAFLNGSGVGQPLGVLNAPCLIAASKETGQNAGTLQYENLTQMMSRLHAGSFMNSIWVVHPTCIPALLQLSLPVGTGGAAIPIMRESDGGFTILTRPVLVSEKMQTLGTQGDILLADFSQYLIGLRLGLRMDTSIHVYFTTDELVTRLIERHDGQPLWNEALTLKDGSSTVSPFVALETRS